MKESYEQCVASHFGLEPCERCREAALEALDGGIGRLGIELRNRLFWRADVVRRYVEADIASPKSAFRPNGVCWTAKSLREKSVPKTR